MKKLRIVLLVVLPLLSSISFAQKSFVDYFEKKGSEKIQKSISMDVFTKPVANKSATDGHGKNPYFTSKSQLPKKVALITFNINDLGFRNFTVATVTYGSLTEEGGNLLATQIHDLSIDKLKAKFLEYGVELLTPAEYLDTEEKINYYYKEFAPEVSKMGEFLSDIETRGRDISAAADYYRYFDLGAANDFLRAQSLGADLASKLQVDAVFSIGFVVQSDEKKGYFRSIKMAMHGPNPTPKQDKKYVAQKMGNGYYEGQLYVSGFLNFDKAIEFLVIGKTQFKEINIKGLDDIFPVFIDRFYAEIYKSIEKAQ